VIGGGAGGLTEAKLTSFHILHCHFKYVIDALQFLLSSW
jgi:hypothetical protein